jgi:hypothetical protein
MENNFDIGDLVYCIKNGKYGRVEKVKFYDFEDEIFYKVDFNFLINDLGVIWVREESLEKAKICKEPLKSIYAKSSFEYDFKFKVGDLVFIDDDLMREYNIANKKGVIGIIENRELFNDKYLSYDVSLIHNIKFKNIKIPEKYLFNNLLEKQAIKLKE